MPPKKTFHLRPEVAAELSELVNLPVKDPKRREAKASTKKMHKTTAQEKSRPEVQRNREQEFSTTQKRHSTEVTEVSESSSKQLKKSTAQQPKVTNVTPHGSTTIIEDKLLQAPHNSVNTNNSWPAARRQPAQTMLPFHQQTLAIC